jgi:hypothetical protein
MNFLQQTKVQMIYHNFKEKAGIISGLKYLVK